MDEATKRSAITSLLSKQADSAGGEEPAAATPSEAAPEQVAPEAAVQQPSSPDEPEVEGLEPDAEEELEQPEAGEDVEPDESEESEEEDREEPELTDRQKERIEKRIGKEVGKRKQAESERDEAVARAKQLEAELRQNRGPESATLYDSQEAVDSRREELRTHLRTLQKHIRAGGYTDPQTQDEISVEELERMEDELVEERDKVLPQVERTLQEREKVEREQVKKLYPALLDRTSPEYAEAEELFARVPGLRGVPDARLLVGRMLRGKRLESAPRRKAAPQSAPRPPVEPTGGTEPRSGVRTPAEPESPEKAMLAAVAKVRQRRQG